MADDDFSPIKVGATGETFAPQFLHKDGTPVNLSGATISMIMFDGYTAKAGAGTWIIDDAANGKAHYLYDAADVAKDADWQLFIAITIGGKPIYADVKNLLILPVPVVP
jgi:hypothetical protein